MKPIYIKASNRKQAAQLALKQIPDNKKIKLKDLKIEKESNIFSMLKSKKTYRVSIKKLKNKGFFNLIEIFELNKLFDFSLKSIVKYDLSGYQKIENAEIIINKTKDKMKAYVDYIPPQSFGKKLTVKDIKNNLKENNIVFGLKEENIKKITESKKTLENILIAEGQYPVEGKDAQLVFHFDRETKNVGTIQEDGSIDFHDLDIVNNVKKGEKLVTKIEAKPGEPGKNIEGESVDPPIPEDISLPKGKNTEITEDNSLISTEVGHISYQQGNVNVLTVYKVNGDVDFKTGNINFNGSVFVKGNVTEGFEIEADGDIQVRGNVEGAYLKSRGNILINKNFIAKNKGKIECEGDFKTKTVQNGKVISKGDVYVKDAIMHSQIFSAGKIMLTGHKGLIVGGEIRATKEVEANIIGSSLATNTIVSAGLDPRTRSKYNTARETLTECKSNYLKTMKALNILNNMKEKFGKLPRGKAEMYERLLETKNDLKRKIKKDEKTVKELSEKINSATKGKITAKRKIYPGVKVQVGKFIKEIDEVHTRTVFKADKGELRRFGI